MRDDRVKKRSIQIKKKQNSSVKIQNSMSGNKNKVLECMILPL